MGNHHVLRENPWDFSSSATASWSRLTSPVDVHWKCCGPSKSWEFPFPPGSLAHWAPKHLPWKLFDKSSFPRHKCSHSQVMIHVLILFRSHISLENHLRTCKIPANRRNTSRSQPENNLHPQKILRNSQNLQVFPRHFAHFPCHRAPRFQAKLSPSNAPSSACCTRSWKSSSRQMSPGGHYWSREYMAIERTNSSPIPSGKR